MSDTAVKTPEKKPGFQIPPTLSYIVSDLGKNGIFLALIAVVVLFSITTNGILLRPQNISNLIVQNGYILILAIGMVLVIVAGHIDRARALREHLAVDADSCFGIGKIRHRDARQRGAEPRLDGCDRMRFALDGGRETVMQTAIADREARGWSPRDRKSVV